MARDADMCDEADGMSNESTDISVAGGSSGCIIINCKGNVMKNAKNRK